MSPVPRHALSNGFLTSTTFSLRLLLRQVFLFPFSFLSASLSFATSTHAASSFPPRFPRSPATSADLHCCCPAAGLHCCRPADASPPRVSEVRDGSPPSAAGVSATRPSSSVSRFSDMRNALLAMIHSRASSPSPDSSMDPDGIARGDSSASDSDLRSAGCCASAPSAVSVSRPAAADAVLPRLDSSLRSRSGLSAAVSSLLRTNGRAPAPLPVTGADTVDTGRRPPGSHSRDSS
mmetsp:Transcript_9904/g.24719  ORF Transcript_9904/g.24719 Transcript_9904/m.24719 type:complete len:235 (+) Transcript_9904:22-726(+)